MKNPEHVAELLAELRTLAENDFERHRIDVLERDLHEPPQVEVIDEEHQKFDGIIYRKQKGNCRGHYVYGNSLHRVVYQYYHGAIPADYDIHHVNENKDDNNADNLICLSRSKHRRLHGGKTLKDKPLRHMNKICKACGSPFMGKSNREYCSVDCRYAHWRSKQYEDAVCSVCGKTYKRFKYNRGDVCSTACAISKAHEIYMKNHTNGGAPSHG